MASGGIIVKDEVVNQYNNFKLKHLYRFIQFKITDAENEIVVEKTVNSSTFDEFVKQLPDKDGRYAVYNYQLDIPGVGLRDQLLFIFWNPDTAAIKNKMMYAASRDALQKKLVGLNLVVSAAERSELSEKDIIAKLRNLVLK